MAAPLLPLPQKDLSPRMNAEPQKEAGSRARDLLEIATVVVVVLILIGALKLIADVRHDVLARRPVLPDSENILKLLPSQSTIEGSITLYPTDFETQRANFTYTHGRKVLKEREEQLAGHWKDSNASLRWDFEIRTAGDYTVRISYACDDASAGSEAEIQIDDKPLLKKIRATGGWDQWKRLNFGMVHLESGNHSLTFKARTLIGEQFQVLQNVLLSPDH